MRLGYEARPGLGGLCKHWGGLGFHLESENSESPFRKDTTTFMVLKSLFSFHPLSAFWFNPGYILCSAHIPSYFSMVNSWSKVIGSEEMAFALSPSLWFLEVAPMLIVFISIPSLSIFFEKKHFNIKRC